MRSSNQTISQPTQQSVPIGSQRVHPIITNYGMYGLAEGVLLQEMQWREQGRYLGQQCKHHISQMASIENKAAFLSFHKCSHRQWLLEDLCRHKLITNLSKHQNPANAILCLWDALQVNKKHKSHYKIDNRVQMILSVQYWVPEMSNPFIKMMMHLSRLFVRSK